MGLLLGLALAACHKEEQAVVGVAQTAVTPSKGAGRRSGRRHRTRPPARQPWL
jgi:hypothetical protein